MVQLSKAQVRGMGKVSWDTREWRKRLTKNAIREYIKKYLQDYD